MKTILFKTAFILLLSFAFIQQSEAHGRFYYRGCAPRYYAAAPRYYGPRYAPAPYYCSRAVAPGHYVIDRYGRREWVSAYYR